jgi:putative FmdB family regulatory protein
MGTDTIFPFRSDRRRRMPLYEFRCERCNKDFEELVPSGTQVWPCPDCGGTEVYRIASVAAFSAGGKMTTTASSSSCGSCSSGSCGSCGCGGH